MEMFSDRHTFTTGSSSLGWPEFKTRAGAWHKHTSNDLCSPLLNLHVLVLRCAVRAVLLDPAAGFLLNDTLLFECKLWDVGPAQDSGTPPAD